MTGDSLPIILLPASVALRLEPALVEPNFSTLSENPCLPIDPTAGDPAGRSQAVNKLQSIVSGRNEGACGAKSFTIEASVGKVVHRGTGGRRIAQQNHIVDDPTRPRRMISLAAATRYDRVAEAGRNRPLRVVVQAEDGEEYEVFLKSSGCPELSVTSLAHEVLAACVAGQVGLPVCRPFLVELTPEWVASVHDAEVRQILQASNPIAFGSTAAGPGWKQWSSDDVLTPARREKAVGIFVFDAWVENPDRKPSNPNLLVKGDEFRIIDHELALLVRGLLPRPAPWQPGYLNHMIGPDSHVFASRLRGGALDLDPIRTAWSNLSDDDLSDYEASLPGQWAEAGDAVTAALTHIRAVRDRIDECLVEIRRILA